jgi:ABC-type transport system substrate-binding protein
MKKILAATLCALLAGSFALTAAGSKGGMLVYGKPKDARSLDPGNIDEGNSSMVASQIFESLLTYKPGTTEIIPWLAKEMPTISKDNLELTFRLRPGVKFHDGTPMNADAVVFSLKRQNDKSHPFNQYGPWKYWSSKAWAATDKDPGIVKDIVKVDDLTVKVVLNKADMSVLYNFTLYFTAVVSPTAAMKLGPEFKNHPVGTGPFQFVEWQKDSHVALKRFEGYWGPKAKVEGVIFKVFPDEQARVLALKKGEADVIDPPGPEGMKTIEADPNLKLHRGDVLSIGYLCLNCESGPFVNKKLREAFVQGVNRKQILDSVYGKTGVAEKLPLPSLLWGYDKKLPDYTYSPDKAKALVKASGVATPIKVNLIYLPAWRPYNPNGKQIAEIIQAQLKPIGFDVTIQTYDIGTYWDNVDAAKFDVCQTGWTGEGDPDDYLFNLFTQGYNNSGRWHNKEYEDLVTKAKLVSAQKDRAALYYKAEKVMMNEAPILMLARGVEFRPMNKRVEGWTTYPTGKMNLALVSLSK